MPDDKTSAPAADKPPVNPDLVGEELADNANVWHVYDRVAKEDDERRTKSWDNGLNNLALFAGLFSAVTTAFIIEARQDMEPDYAQLAFLVLNATAFGEKPVHQPFIIPSSARTVNCLWISSLILSLSAALIAIMGKDWIGMYTARPVCNLRQWAEMRTYRLLCVERWYMSGVIAAAPVLLHVSLVLFGAGLVLFISSDPFTHHLTLGLSLAAGALYLVTTLSAIIFSASPFKSPATQMLRTALAAFFSYVIIATARPKRGLVDTLLRDLNTMVVGYEDQSDFARASEADANGRLPQRLVRDWTRPICPPGRNAVTSPLQGVNIPVVDRADDFPLLPTSTPYVRQQHNLHLLAAVRTAPGRTSVTLVQWLPSPLRAAWRSLQWLQVQSQLHSVASRVSLIPFSDWFLSSLWTDLPTDRRPKLLAEALSWLSGASQAPDVFRALMFALGDLEVGAEVGRHAFPALCTRLRAEIRRTWQQVDFLTLSRYVLADRNTPGDPVLSWPQFAGRFDLSKDSALRCEDGLAAVIRVDPGYILPGDLVKYSPDQVAQSRMHELVLPHIQKPQRYLTDVLILLSNRYRAHLGTTKSFNLGNLEAHLYQTLDARTREAYATEVTVKYGGTSGAIELLTFLCCHGGIDNDTKRAAVELVMELVEREDAVREHRCLAYLFGTKEIWDAAWKDKRWSPWSLHWLSRSLEVSRLHPFEPTSVRTLSDDRLFGLVLARTAAMMLSPAFRIHYGRQTWIKFLHDRLCRSPSPSDPDNDEDLHVVRLVLEAAALATIVGYHGDVVMWGTAILTAIISHLARRLHDAATIDDGEQLLAALVHTEVNGPDGETFMWDLGEWLRTTAPEILQQAPSSADAMRDVHDALSALYPLCEHNPSLRAAWDRIGYSGPPEEIIYLCDPYLDIGKFFARAEDPLSQLGV